MSDTERKTLERIHAAAKKEFLEKGFRAASLRAIVKAAGVTTGAFYGYYDSKEALFEALIIRQYDTVMTLFCNAQHDFTKLPFEEQPKRMSAISLGCMKEILRYSYDYPEEFELLLCHAEGTRFARMIDEMVEIETEGTHDYQQTLQRLGRTSPEIDPGLEHILITGMFNAYFELILHKMPPKAAEAYLETLHAFYTAGWLKILNQ